MQTAAVVVWIDKYSKNRLTSAVNDALAFKDALIQHEMVTSPKDIILLRTNPQPGDLEPTRDNIIDTLYSFYQDGDQLGRLIFFFAGNAILTFSDAARARTRTILLPIDVHDLDAHGNRLIDLNEVLDFMRHSGPQEQILIIDACREDGQMGPRWPPQTSPPSELDQIASRLCESVHGFFQSLWRATSIESRLRLECYDLTDRGCRTRVLSE